MPKAKQLTWVSAGWAAKCVAVGVPLLFFCFAGFHFYRSSRSLASFDVAQGEVTESGVVQIAERTRPFIACFRLRDAALPFGIYCGQSRLEAEAFAAKIGLKSPVKVYYDASGAVADGINLHIAQIEKGNRLIYSIHESRARDLFMGTGFSVFGIAFALWIALSMREKNQPT